MLATLTLALQALSAQIADHPERLVLAEIAHAQTIEEQLPPEPVKPPRLSESDLATLVARYATLYGVKHRSMMETIKCEAPRTRDGSYDPLGQSLHRKKDGTREQSYGLAQINLPSHPKVSLEQAQDPEFAIEFMAKKFANDEARLWTCWRVLKSQGKI